MNQDFLILNLAVFAASTLQSATGVGFGVIAGPVLLVALHDGSAIQISIVLNLLIATLLAPSVWRDANSQLLQKLIIGLLIGSPLGYLVFLKLEFAWLKVLAGIAVLFTLIMTARGSGRSPQSQAASPGHAEQLSLGVVAGLMGASLAMPGPVPAGWMSFRGFSKTTIRATILLMFLAAYAFALALQFTTSGVSADNWRLSVVLAPATIGGVVAGRMLSRRISERVFHWMLLIILAVTATIIFWSFL